MILTVDTSNLPPGITQDMLDNQFIWQDDEIEKIDTEDELDNDEVIEELLS